MIPFAVWHEGIEEGKGTWVLEVQGDRLLLSKGDESREFYWKPISECKLFTCQLPGMPIPVVAVQAAPQTQNGIVMNETKQWAWIAGGEVDLVDNDLLGMFFKYLVTNDSPHGWPVAVFRRSEDRDWMLAAKAKIERYEEVLRYAQEPDLRAASLEHWIDGVRRRAREVLGSSA